MAIDKLQASRFELKYMISEEVALQVRDFVSSYLALDENGVGKPDYSYPVHSLYLDSDDLKLYWATINGDKNRFKLRIRFYSDHDDDAPVFFEIKRRVNNCIMKQRGGVKRSAVEALLAGHPPTPQDLVSQSNPKHEFALLRFCELMQQIDAKPKAHIAYYREAYVPEEPPPPESSISSPRLVYSHSTRLTMDRRVRIEPELTARLSTKMNHPTTIWGKNEIILELKFTDRFPDWLGELVRIFQLKQRGAAKYVDGVALVGEQHFSLAGACQDSFRDDKIFLPNLSTRVLINEES